jgi:hypothetical protein
MKTKYIYVYKGIISVLISIIMILYGIVIMMDSGVNIALRTVNVVFHGILGLILIYVILKEDLE